MLQKYEAKEKVMDIESARLALSAWVAVLPTVMSLGLMSLLAFYYRASKPIKKFNRIAFFVLAFIILLGMSSLILTIVALVGTDMIFLSRDLTFFWIVFILDWISVLAIYIFLIWHLYVISEIK